MAAERKKGYDLYANYANADEAVFNEQHVRVSFVDSAVPSAALERLGSELWLELFVEADFGGDQRDVKPTYGGY